MPKNKKSKNKVSGSAAAEAAASSSSSSGGSSSGGSSSGENISFSLQDRSNLLNVILPQDSSSEQLNNSVLAMKDLYEKSREKRLLEIHPIVRDTELNQRLLDSEATYFMLRGKSTEIYDRIDIPPAGSITKDNPFNFRRFEDKSEKIMNALKNKKINMGNLLDFLLSDKDIDKGNFKKSMIKKCFGLFAYYPDFVVRVSKSIEYVDTLNEALAERIRNNPLKKNIRILIQENNRENEETYNLLKETFGLVINMFYTGLLRISRYESNPTDEENIKLINDVFNKIERSNLDHAKKLEQNVNQVKMLFPISEFKQNVNRYHIIDELTSDEKTQDTPQSDDTKWKSVIEAFEEYHPDPEVVQVIDSERKQLVPQAVYVEDNRKDQPQLPRYFLMALQHSPIPALQQPITQESLTQFVLDRNEQYIEYRTRSRKQVIDVHQEWTRRNQTYDFEAFNTTPYEVYSSDEIRMSDIANIWYTYGFGNVQRLRFENYILGCSHLSVDRVNPQFHIHLFRWNDSPEGRGRDEHGTALLKCFIPGNPKAFYHLLSRNITIRYKRKDAYDIAEYLYFLSIGILQLSGSCHDIANVVRAPETTLRYYKDGTLEPFSGKKQRNRYLAYL